MTVSPQRKRTWSLVISVNWARPELAETSSPIDLDDDRPPWASVNMACPPLGSGMVAISVKGTVGGGAAA